VRSRVVSTRLLQTLQIWAAIDLLFVRRGGTGARGSQAEEKGRVHRGKVVGVVVSEVREEERAPCKSRIDDASDDASDQSRRFSGS
jgi:hypothetical protein